VYIDPESAMMQSVYYQRAAQGVRACSEQAARLHLDQLVASLDSAAHWKAQQTFEVDRARLQQQVEQVGRAIPPLPAACAAAEPCARALACMPGRAPHTW
jgi:ABC-type phosphate transport system auxiliary subunit